jgi:hypothetical protein
MSSVLISDEVAGAAVQAQLWLHRARRVALELSLTKRQLTTDDVLAHCPVPPGVSKLGVGAVFMGMKSSFVKVGETWFDGTRKRNRPVFIWERRDQHGSKVGDD